MRQLARVIDSDRLAISFDPLSLVNLHVSRGKKRRMQALPQRHYLTIRFNGALPAAAGQWARCRRCGVLSLPGAVPQLFHEHFHGETGAAWAPPT